MWYYDEVVIRDPLALLLEDEPSNLERDKERARHTLQSLSYFQQAVDDGYVLFAGASLSTPLPDTRPPIAEALARDVAVSAALRLATYCGHVVRPDQKGTPTHVFQFRLDSGECFHLKWHIKGTGREWVSGPSIIVGETTPAVEPEELRGLLGEHDPWKHAERLFPREIHKTIASLARAQQFGGAALFDREVDGVILSRAGMDLTPEQQTPIRLLKLALPYVQGIPPERLSALRAKIPRAFLDFRGALAEVIFEAQREGAIDYREIRMRAESRIQPQLRALDAEMKASIKSSKILYLGVPLVSAVGVLAGLTLGVPASVLLGVGVTGAVGTVKGVADSVKAVEKAKGHPCYFL